MLNKKIVLLSIFLVSLLAVSAVSATENMSDDIISHEDVSFDSISVDSKSKEAVSIDSADENSQQETLADNSPNDVTDKSIENELESYNDMITVHNATIHVLSNGPNPMIEVNHRYEGNLSVFIDGSEMYNKEISSVFLITPEELNCVGTHNMKIYFINDTVNEKIFDGLVNIDYDIYVEEMDDEVPNVLFYDSFRSNVYVPYGFNGLLTLNYNNQSYNLIYNDEKYAKFNISISELKIGLNKIIFNLTGDNVFPDKEFTYLINVIPKVDVPTVISNGETDFIVINLPDYYNGIVNIYNTTRVSLGWNNDTGEEIFDYTKHQILKTMDIVNGSVNVPLDFLKIGENLISINCSGNGDYEDYFFINLIENNQNFNASISSNEINEGGNVVLRIDAPKSSKSISVYVDGKLYNTVSLDNGGFDQVISNLNLGNHKIKVIYIDDEWYESYDGAYSNSFYVTVKKFEANLSCTVKEDNKGKYIDISLKDNLGNPINKVQIDVIVDNERYKMTTNSTGQNKVYLCSGEYYPDVSPEDEEQGNHPAISFTEDLTPGNHLVTITFKGNRYYQSAEKTLEVNIADNLNNGSSNGVTNSGVNSPTSKTPTKTTLTLKKVTVKKSAKKLTIQATLKVNGKGVKGKIIKFKFNKKTYKAKTNAKGVAKISVKKSVLKKLKKGKKITYTAAYGKITKKVTVKVK